MHRILATLLALLLPAGAWAQTPWTFTPNTALPAASLNAAGALKADVADPVFTGVVTAPAYNMIRPYNPAGGALVPPVSWSITPSGTTSSHTPALISWSAATDTLAVPNAGADHVYFLNLSDAFGGSTMTGNRVGMLVKTTQVAKSGNLAAGSSGPFYGAVSFAHQQNDTEGGTTTGQAGSYGNVFAGGTIIRTLPAATFMHEVTNWEADMNTAAASYKKFGIKVTQLTTDIAQGALDGAFVIENGGSSALNGWHTGFLAIQPNGNFPYASDGCILCAPTSNDYGTVPNNLARGVDLQEPLFSAYAFRSRGFGVDGAGTLHVGNGYLAATAGGTSLGTTGSVGPAEGTTIFGVAIVNGGTGGRLAGNLMYGPNGGVYNIDSVVAGVVTQVSVLRTPYFASATPPANPLTLIDGHSGNGTGTVQVNQSWTQPNTLALQLGAGITTIGGALNVAGITSLTNNLAQTGTHTITVAGSGGTSTIASGLVSATHLQSGLGLTTNYTGSTGAPNNTNTTLLTSVNMTGTPTSGSVAPHSFTINGDDMDGSGLASGTAGMILNYNFGGAAMRDGRTGLNVSLTQTADITSQSAAGSNSFVAGSYHVLTSHSLGGTNTAAGSKGFFYGLYPQILAKSGATNITLLNVWGEGDIAVEAGATVNTILGRSTILLPTHAVAGAQYNIVDLVGAATGAVPTWTNGYTFGGGGSPWPMAASATLQGTVLQTVCGNLNKGCQLSAQSATYGTDWGTLDLVPQSGFGFRSPGFAVDATGQGWFANGGLQLTSNATGYAVDIANAQSVTSVAIAVAGTAAGDGQNNYYPGDLMFGTSTPTPGQYRITDTKVIAVTVAAGGSGGTPGACTITGTTGTGTKFQATGTVTAGALGGALVVTVPGDYTVNPTSLTAEPVTGCGLVAATVKPGMGALTLTVQVPGVYAACPGGGGITPTGGSGVGLTLTPTCGLRDGITLAGATRKLGLYGATPIAKATPVGACAGSTGCQALRDALVNLGAINGGSISN